MVATYMADQADQEQMRVYTFLVGSPTAMTTLVPRYIRQVDRRRGGYDLVVARDERGRVIYERSPEPFATDPQLMQEIARLTGGEYFEAFDERQFREQFEVLAGTEFRTTTRTRKRDLFLPWLLVGLGVLLLEWWLRVGPLRKFP